VKVKLVEASNSLSREREGEEQDSNEVVRDLQILKEHFPERVSLWHLRTEEALNLFSEEIEGVETKAQVRELLRRMGFRSKSSRFGKHVLGAYEIPGYRLEKLLERYGFEG
jgi:coproporphyrinogen III oxidase-like Fe-S oxidoreductase